MINKNDFLVYRKYEGDKRYYNYDFDTIKDKLLYIAEDFGIEDRIEEYIDGIESIIELMINELNEANWYLDDFQNDYNNLEEERVDLLERIRELEERIEELED